MAERLGLSIVLKEERASWIKTTALICSQPGRSWSPEIPITPTLCASGC